MSTSKVEFTTVDGMFVKQIVLRAGEVVPQHVHVWDHTTLLAVGQVIVWCEGETGLRRAPSIIWVEAGKRHEFQALTDAVLYCLHNLKGAQAVEILARHDVVFERD